jgi:hypothetical protein
MADNVPLPASEGSAATDERTVEGAVVQIQRVVEIGASAIASGQVAPTNVAANIVAARDVRQRLILYNVGTVDVYVGPGTVTTSNGLKLPPGASMELKTTAAVQGITASGTGAVHYIEEYS